MKFVSILVALVALAFMIVDVGCDGGAKPPATDGPATGGPASTPQKKESPTSLDPAPLRTWHSDPWDQRVLVLSGIGVYYHKVNQADQPDVNVGSTEATLAVFVPANTEHGWETNAGELHLLSYFTMPPHPQNGWHFEPWEQHVSVLSGTGKYHHKIDDVEQEPQPIRATGSTLAVFVPPLTDHDWKASTASTLDLGSYFTVPPH